MISPVSIPVSVVIPVRNEERNLPECLARLTDFAEVIVVDSGSTDGTRALAERAGVQFVAFHWDGKFPKKRNWCLRNLTFCSDWVLFLDADEWISDAFKHELRMTLPQTRYNGFMVFYDNWFLGKRLRHGDRMRKLPLFRIGKGEYERIEEEHWSALDMEVHEHPVLEGPVGRLRTSIEHRENKGQEAYRARHAEYAAWEARRYLALRKMPRASLTSRQRFKYALLDTWLAGPLYFVVSYFAKAGWLDGWAGYQLARHKLVYFLAIKRNINALRRR
jgi:glycosyltransferase involved in cell wall biosynthesis